MGRKAIAFRGVMERYGFERIEVGAMNRYAYWKQLGERHITMEPSDFHKFCYPNFKDRYVLISIYRGVELMKDLEHQETAYIAEDLLSFLEEYCGDDYEVEPRHNYGR